MGAATSQASNRMANLADAREVSLTLGATVEKPTSRVNRSEWQIVATFLIADPKIVARLPPFPAVRRDSPATSAESGQ
jgi:hypothetical protein